MAANPDDLADALHDLADGLPPRDEGDPQHGDRPCPICGELMLIESFHGVEIDTCPAHGIWLDHAELEAVLAVSARRDPARRQRTLELMKRAKRDGKLTGAFFGYWSLLLPD
jgi:Zn-finger nucleic acid-binding protein